MYLRRSVVRKNGKTHCYWRLVRSVRIGHRVRQELVATLGELTTEGQLKASKLAKHFLKDVEPDPDLFETEKAPEVEIAKVRCDQIRVERGRSFGDVWIGWLLWQVLGFDKLAERLIPYSNEGVRWSDVAVILVLARFCEPSSELHIAEDWYEKTALPDVLHVAPEDVHHMRLYRGLDHLLPHKEAFEAHLKERLGRLFELKYDVLLYDVTSTYFEGTKCGGDLAQYGYSRDKRSDCKQVCVALVVTREGYPLAYEVFPGNTTDVTTVQGIVAGIENRYGKADRVWAMDRGMISEENLTWLREGGRKYVLGTPRSELKKWQAELVEKRGWSKIRDGLEVKLCNGPDGKEVFVLCRSEDRRKKEQATHERFTTKVVAGLESLKRRLEGARKEESIQKVERQIGRLLQRYSRAAGKFVVRVEEDRSTPSGLKVSWTVNEAWKEWAELSEGAYVLRSNVTNWSHEDLWKTYVQLADVENAFRVQKSDLVIRPIWHHREDRVRAHIFVCFLAYAMWKTLEGWQSRAGLGNSPRTILDELRKIQSVDVILPLATGEEMRLRCVVRPDKDQALLLDRLGVRLPKRLRQPAGTAKM